MADKTSASQFAPASRANSTRPMSLSVWVRARARPSNVIDHVRIAASSGHGCEMPLVNRFPRRRHAASSLRLTRAKTEGWYKKRSCSSVGQQTVSQLQRQMQANGSRSRARLRLNQHPWTIANTAQEEDPLSVQQKSFLRRGKPGSMIPWTRQQKKFRHQLRGA